MKPLIDAHGRQIRYLRVSVTDRCNLRCKYCMPSSGVEWIPHEQIMRYEELLRIVRICTSRGVEKVRITGGEPLLRKGITGFIGCIREMEGIRDLSLTTNGVQLSSMACELKNAGLHRLNISLDTLDREKFIRITGVDAFEKVVSGIKKSVDLGFSPVKINAVAIRGINDDEIPSFADLTMRYDVEIRFIELMPMGCATRYGDHEIIGSSEIRGKIEERFGALESIEYSQGPARVFRIKGAKGRIGLIGAMSEHTFCSRCNRIRVTANGHLRPCLFSEKDIDLLTPMRQGISDTELEVMIEEGVRMKKLNHGLCAGKPEALRQGCKTMMNTLGG